MIELRNTSQADAIKRILEDSDIFDALDEFYAVVDKHYDEFAPTQENAVYPTKNPNLLECFTEGEIERKMMEMHRAGKLDFDVSMNTYMRVI